MFKTFRLTPDRNSLKLGEYRLRELPKIQISLQALTVWKLSALISAIIFLLIVAAIGVGVYFLEFTYWITVAVAFVWLVISFISIFVIPKIKHRIWRYEVHEHEVRASVWTICRKKSAYSNGESSAC